MISIPVGAGLAEGLRRLALRAGIVPPRNPIVPQHTARIPDLGGLALTLHALVVFAVLLALGTDTGGVGERMVAWGPPALAFLLLGLVDDRRPLAPATKLAWQLACAVLAVALGAVAPITGRPVVDAPLVVVWIVAVVNAYNFTDVCDGLLCGVAAIGLVAVSVLAPRLWLLCAVLASGCAAVLVLNRPPARIFLGDGGSHLLGYSAAILSLAAARDDPAPLRLVVAVLLVSVPLFELLFITAARISKGLPWWRGSPDHFSLRLQAMGYSRWLAAGVGWLLALLGGVAAVGLPRVGTTVQAIIVTLELVLLAAFARWLVTHERMRA